MRKVGVLAAGFMLGWCIFWCEPKVYAASSGVVVATVQIRRPLSNNLETTQRTPLSNIAIVTFSWLLNITGSIYSSNIPIRISLQTINYS
jgi:hypothetical protein